MCVTLSTAARQTRRGGCDTVMDCPAVTRSHIENTATAGAGCEQVSQRCNALSFSLPANQFICVCVCVSIIRRRMKLWILNGMEIEWRRCRRSVRKHRVEQRRLELEHNNVLQLARYSDCRPGPDHHCRCYRASGSRDCSSDSLQYAICLMSIVNCYRFALGPTKGRPFSVIVKTTRLCLAVGDNGLLTAVTNELLVLALHCHSGHRTPQWSPQQHGTHLGGELRRFQTYPDH